MISKRDYQILIWRTACGDSFDQRLYRAILAHGDLRQGLAQQPRFFRTQTGVEEKEYAWDCVIRSILPVLGFAAKIFPVFPQTHGKKMTCRSDFLRILEQRGYLHQATNLEGLDARLEKGPITAYCGFDPTGDSFHVGNLVQIMQLRRLQQAGASPFCCWAVPRRAWAIRPIKTPCVPC